MKHAITKLQLKEILPKIKNIDVALLYGSYARKDATENSDLDIKLIVNDKFDHKTFIETIKNEFQKPIKSINYIKLRNKIIIYFSELPKVEIGLCYNINDIDRDFLRSEITVLDDLILFEKNKEVTQIETHLEQLIYSKKDIDSSYFNNLIDKFVYEFESCSSKHSRSDGYLFYFFYNIAFHIAVQLEYISNGKEAYHFLPKNLITKELSIENQSNFYKLNGTLFLTEANKKKRELLVFFYGALKKIVPSKKYNEIEEFCEWVYQRDFFWNFRDSSLYNAKIKKQKLFRSSALALFENTEELDKLLAKNNIKTIIDLRADREIDSISYSEKTLNKIKYIKAQFDPWNQPEWFKKKYNYGSNQEIAYRFFAMGCKDSIKKTLETILEEKNGAIVIHCHAGKDRTGIIFSLLHLLLESSLENINTDYLASEMDVSLNKLEIVLDIIKNEGGILNYLLSCGLNKTQIMNLKNKLSNE